MVFGCPKCKSTNIVVAGMTYLCKNCGNTFSINEAIEVKGFLGFLGKLFSKKEKPKDDKGKGKDEKPEEGKKPGESEKPKEKKSIIGTLLKVGGIFALIIAVVVGGIFGYKAIPESAKAGVGKYLKTLSCIFSGDYQQCMISEQTPEAEKIGGYQAVSIQFGSKYNNYQVPMIYARDDSGYYLPITVSNPNPEEDKELTVENFYIKSSFWSNDPGVSEYEKDADMVGGSNLKIMCGIADICTENNNADCQKLPPGIDKEILIRFIDYSKDKENGDCSSASDFKIRLSDSECQETCTINKNEDGKSKIEAVKACSDNSTCANSLCEDKCKDPEYNFLDFVNYTYDASTKKCICERNRNNFNELCSEKFGQSATIKFLASYNFFVVGNGEFGFVQTEKDLKLLPKPKITTSAGPLSLTVYFLPSYVINEKDTGRDVRMFLNLKNDGSGDAEIKDISIVQNLQDNAQVKFETDSIESCLSELKSSGKIRVSAGESWGKSCSLGYPSVSGQTGPFATIPITVNMKYSYEELISRTVPIKKVAFDPNAGKDYSDVPGYCPI